MKQPYHTLDVKKQEARPRDWVLMFRLPGVTSLDWMHVDFVVKVHKSEADFDKDFHFRAVQANRPKAYRPPFKITNDIRQAFKRSVKAYGQKRNEQIRSASRRRSFCAKSYGECSRRGDTLVGEPNWLPVKKNDIVQTPRSSYFA